METTLERPQTKPKNSSPAASGSTVQPATCRECGGAFTYELPPAGNPFYDFVRKYTPSICAACDDLREERMRSEAVVRDAEAIREQRFAEWKTICPPLYRDTNPKRLPITAVTEIEAWEGGSRGLAFAGATGRGKTRSMLLLLNRWHMRGHRVGFVSAVAFGHAVARHSGERMSDLDAYLRSLIRLDILCLDDLGKEKLTERVASEFYHVIEQRVANLRPVMFTAQMNSEQLAARMGEDRGAAVIRRLEEFCRVVVL